MLPHGGIDANAEFQRGLVTPLGSDAKEEEGRSELNEFNSSLYSPSFGILPLARLCSQNRTYSIARVENTKLPLFKEQKLFVWLIGME